MISVSRAMMHMINVPPHVATLTPWLISTMMVPVYVPILILDATARVASKDSKQ
jgi:hypothetical protein